MIGPNFIYWCLVAYVCGTGICGYYFDHTLFTYLQKPYLRFFRLLYDISLQDLVGAPYKQKDKTKGDAADRGPFHFDK